MDELNLGELDSLDNINVSGVTQDEVSEVSEMVFYFENNEGPLDVLWRLIKSTKLSIKDVHLADITGQFLDYIRSLKNIDMEAMSWFIKEAAKLLEIKSDSLIPRPESEAEAPEEDLEALYKKRMELYRLFKETSVVLGAQENVDRMYKEPEKSANDYKIVLKDMNMESLVDAFSKLLLKVEKKAAPVVEKKIQKDRFTVRDCFQNILNKLENKSKLKFEELFGADFSRSEVINTFLALLELLKMQHVSVVQDDIFGEISIEKKEGEVDNNAEELTEYN